MLKHTISIFLTVLFLGLISAPTLIIAFDDSVDVSVFYSISEEEEETKNLKLVVLEIDTEDNLSEFTSNNRSLDYFFKTYPKPHLNLISPPPEFIS